MPDQWDFDSVNQSIGVRIQNLHTRLHEIQTYKLKRSESYKKEHDEIIGALYVSYILENHADLVGKSSYISLLRSMLDREPPRDDQMFSYDNVKNGWRSEILMKLQNLGEKP